MKGAVKSR